MTPSHIVLSLALMAVDGVVTLRAHDYLHRLSGLCDGFYLRLGQLQRQSTLLYEGRRDHKEDEQEKHDVDQGCQVNGHFRRAAPLKLHSVKAPDDGRGA